MSNDFPQAATETAECDCLTVATALHDDGPYGPVHDAGSPCREADPRCQALAFARGGTHLPRCAAVVARAAAAAAAQREERRAGWDALIAELGRDVVLEASRSAPDLGPASVRRMLASSHAAGFGDDLAAYRRDFSRRIEARGVAGVTAARVLSTPIDLSAVSAAPAPWRPNGATPASIHTANIDQETLTRMEAQLLDRDQLDALPPVTPLIRGVIDARSVSLLSGKFGTYKTFVSVGWACSVATGRPWLDHDVVTPGRVLYVAGEGAYGIHGRIRAWEHEHNAGARIPASELYVYNGRISFLDRDQVGALGAIARRLKPTLIVVDTLHKAAAGADEDKSKDMGLILDVAQQLVEEIGAHVLFNHHTGHNGERSRGSSSLEDDVDNSWVIKLDGDGEDRSPDNPRIMTHRKVKDGELHADLPIELKSVAFSMAPSDGSAVVVAATAAPVGLGAKWLVAKKMATMLDDAGYPSKMTADATTEAGKALGQHHARTVWLDVRRIRIDTAKADPINHVDQSGD